MAGRTVEEAHPILRMFMLCEAMKWSHLPNAGGIYDQHPDLLDGFLLIFSERSRYEAAEQKRQEAKNKSPASRARGRSPRRR